MEADAGAAGGAIACHLLRLGFVAVAAPLTLTGVVLSQVSDQSLRSSVRYFEYALMEQEAALASEAASASDIAIATQDQVLVAELEAKAAEEQGVALEEAEAAVENEAGVAGKQAGEEAAGTAAEEATEVIHAQVEQAVEAAMEDATAGAEMDGAAAAAEGASAAVAEGAVGAAAAEGAGVAAAEGAGVAVAEGAGAAAAEGGTLAALEAGAAGTEVVSGGLATPIVVAGAAATAAVMEGPKIVAGVTEEWGAASSEIQAARDEALAVEKEVEAQSFEIAAGVYQAGAAEQEAAALAAASTGVSLVVLAQVSQLVALAAQAPVAAIWLLGKAGSGVGVAYSAFHGGAEAGGALLAMASAVSQTLFAGAFLVEPWADTLLMAADAQKAASGADILESVSGFIDDLGAKLQRSSVAERRLNWFWDQTMGAAKHVLVSDPNKETTTVAIPTTQPPPADPPGWFQLMVGGLVTVGAAVVQWLFPVLADITLASLVVALIQGIPLVGSHLPRLWCDECRSPGHVCTSLVHGFVSQWFVALSLLGGVWILSLAFAMHLQGAAQAVQSELQGGGGAAVSMAALVLGMVSLAVALYRAAALSQGGCPSCTKKGNQPESVAVAACCAATGCVGSIVAAVLGAAVGALEAPVCSAALGGAGRSLLASWWLLPMLPWDLMAHELLDYLPGWMRPLARLHVPGLLALCCVLSALAAALLIIARKRSEEELPDPGPDHPGLALEDMESPILMGH